MPGVKFSKLSIFIVLAAVLFSALAFFEINAHTPRNSVENFNIAANPGSKQPAASSSGKSSQTDPQQQPATLNLKVPFTAQAPTGNWDQLHNEACEEASAIMANAYFSGVSTATLPADQVEQQISQLTNWEIQNLGHNLDSTSAETAKMIESAYNLKTSAVQNFTAADLRQALAAGHLVLISEYGRALGNPNYKQPGPVHHMLLIRGYTPEGFITNDSGTRRGQNYFYTFDTLYNAAGDWDLQANDIDRSLKIAIIVSR